MSEKSESSELEKFKDIFLDYVLQLDALTPLFIEKGLITNEEFSAKLDKVCQECDYPAIGKLL